MIEQRFPRRINVPLTERQARALFDLAQANKRLTRDQAQFLIAERLEQLGLLPVEKPALARDVENSGG